MKTSNEVLVELNNITGGKQNNTTINGYLIKHVVGGNVEYKLKKTIANWEMSEDTMEIAKEVLCLDDVNEQELCSIVNEMMQLPDSDLLRALFNLANGNEPYRIVLRKLYYVWENLIEILLHIAEKKKINVDSIIQESGYKKLGFCPYDVLNRMDNLLTFPIGSVIDKIGIDVYMHESDLELLENEIKVPVTIDRPKGPLAGVKNCIEVIIMLYKNLFNNLLEIEARTIIRAKKLSDFCDKVEDLCKIIIKHV